jgi:hypothetical protein
MTQEIKTINIYEMDYSAHPNGVNAWDIYDDNGEWLAMRDTLVDAVTFAAGYGKTFTVHTLEAWHAKEGN